MVARGVRVAADREPADDPLRGFRDEHGGVRVAAERAEVAALLVHAPPVGGRDQPAAGLGADLVRERDERRGVAGLGGADREVAAHAAKASALDPLLTRRGAARRERERERDDQRDRHGLHLAGGAAAGRAHPRATKRISGARGRARQSPAEKWARRLNSTGGLLCSRIHGRSASNPRPPRLRGGTGSPSLAATQSTGVTRTAELVAQLRGLPLRLLQVHREVAAELRLDEEDAVRPRDEVVDVPLPGERDVVEHDVAAPSEAPRAPRRRRPRRFVP